ncbi:hypothetical protein CBW57_01525 [Yersinia intermedia]|uniref:Uncharacterized protein n=1 Tax=Yersinia intermedia TaxID=631 RepID=A0A209AB88_YERIN|nr:hypothetical protein CBW57_01525 [Yersinia intermedia]
MPVCWLRSLTRITYLCKLIGINESDCYLCLFYHQIKVIANANNELNQLTECLHCGQLGL